MTAAAPAGFRARWLPLILAADVAAVDQLSKWLVERAIPLHDVRPVLPFFNLTHVLNTGASFGMFQDSNRAFIGVTVLILAILAVLHRRLAAEGPLTRTGLALLWGGAVGNLVDRLRVGAVIDFLDFHWGAHHWPAFNVADSAITVGVGLVFLQNLRRGRDQDLPR